MYDSYLKSENSVECILTRRNDDGRIQIGLSRQKRSPFISDENYDEHLYEAVAGMMENGENPEIAAIREVKEETGYNIEKEQLRHLIGPITISLATQENTTFYLCEIGNNQKKGEQSLDEQECIEQIRWFNIDEIDAQNLHAPLNTKYAILRAREYYAKEKKKTMDDVDCGR